jgi:hypothetical protein
MALASLNYSPAVTGSQIKNAIQAKSQPIRSAALAQSAATSIWTTILNEIYKDFASTLSTAIQSYICTAQVLFIPAPPSQYTVTSLSLNSFKTKAQSTASTIVNEISSNANPNNPTESQAIKIWTCILKNIFVDMKNIVGSEVANACNAGVAVVNPGAIAPPHTGTISPVPAALSNQFQASYLQQLMNMYYNENNARAIASSMVSTIKSQKMQPEQIWDLLIEKLKTGVNSDLQKHIKSFLTLKKYYSIPLGTPGRLIIYILPTSGTVYGSIL